MNNKRKHIMFKRRLIRVRRRFSVEYLGGTQLKYTCRTCGHATVKDMNDGHASISPLAVEKLAKYQDQGGGASGICDRCTKRARDEKFPLPAG